MKTGWYPFAIARERTPSYLTVRDLPEGSGVEFGAVAYGQHAAQAAAALVSHLRAWDARGRALPSVKAALDLFAITWVEITNAEADDVIATLAASCPQRDMLIASVDQDYYQLLRDAGPGHGSVRVLNTARRAGRRLAGPAEVQERHGVTPAQFADYRALAGDASDNIPGVRGIGAKTAAALLDGGLTLDDLPASGRLAGCKGTAITAAWQQVLTWRDMIRMNSQVAVPGEAITGVATMPLPRPAEVIEKLGLWRRVTPAEQNGVLR